MPRPPKNKRIKPPAMLDTDGIEIDTTPKKFKKEDRERKQREQEAARESD